MNFITIQGTYSNWVIVPSEVIRKKPKRVFLTLEYESENKSDLFEVFKQTKKTNKNFSSIDDLFYDLEN